jgi:two-component system nitrate/nitrite response regulator NarL
LKTLSYDPDMAAAPMKVAVHSQRRLIGEALAWCLATHPGLNVVGHTQEWAQLVSLCKLRRPDAVIVDAAPAEVDETVRQMRRLSARGAIGHVLLLSEVPPRHASVTGGASWRYLSNARGLEALVAALMDRRFIKEVAKQPARSARLTEREIEVLTMVSTGLTAPEIADRLDIGHRSVENHKRRIYAKLGANNQAAAVGVVAPLGILDVQPRASLDGHKTSVPALSRRETEILHLSANGASVRQMATTLGVAPKTVETQLSLLYRKLGVHNRASALAVARAHGLIPES